MHAGHFREDLYYRLCGDLITTPSLTEQLNGCPEGLADLLRLIIKRLNVEEEDELTAENKDWIEKSPGLGPAYAWPGSFRELNSAPGMC